MNYEALTTPQYEALSQRLELLFECLWHCTKRQENGRKYIFSVNERILINQERGALMSQQSFMLYGDESQVRHFELPKELEEKVQFIKSKL
jgi:hypothetical protein